MSDYASELLREATDDALDEVDAALLLAELDSNAPLREDVVTLLAQFKVNLGPFFLRALVEHLQGRTSSDADETDPVRYALRIAFALPVAEIGAELAGEQLGLLGEAA